MEDLRVTGWTNSKASTNPDRGRGSLIGFLERKAQGRSGPVRIRGSRVEGDTLIITVNAAEKDKFLRLNNFTFAGVLIQVEQSASTFTPLRPHPNTKAPRQTSPNSISPGQSLPELLKHFLNLKYDPALKLLNLSALRNDPELQNIIKIIDPRAWPASFNVFGGRTSESKFFPALMKVADDQFTSVQDKRDLIQSVSVASNDLTNIVSITTLAQTFPDLKNLDLSNNKFQNLRALDGWRHRFRYLDHLVLTGNPLEQTTPTYGDELARWFPSLRILNGFQFRSDEEVAENLRRSTREKRPTSSREFDPSRFDGDLAMDGGNVNGALANQNTAVQAPAISSSSNGPSPDQLKEQMCRLLSRTTNMTMDYSLKALEETGWNFDEAMSAFERVRGSLPPAAFVNQLS